MSDPTNAALVTKRQPEIILPFHCEVCNISCNSKDVLELHKQGKKHLKTVKKLADSSSNAPNMVPPPVASETVVGALENKTQRLLKNGAPAERLLYCYICNVTCNHQEGFQKHVDSKKHSAKNRRGAHEPTIAVFDATSDSSGGSQEKPAGFPCEICKIVCTSDELLKLHIGGKKHLKKVKGSGQIPNPHFSLTPIASEDTPPTNTVVNPESNEDKTVNLHGAVQSTDPESSEGKTVISHGAIQSTDPESTEGKTAVNLVGAKRDCELCGTSCDDELSGEKQLTNLEKSEKLIGPNPAETPKVIGPLQEDGVEGIGYKRKGKKGGGDDDVGAKKLKILKTVMALDDVQIGNLYNLVFNSQEVFIAHPGGQKHAPMGVKQAETDTNDTLVITKEKSKELLVYSRRAKGVDSESG